MVKLKNFNTCVWSRFIVTILLVLSIQLGCSTGSRDNTEKQAPSISKSVVRISTFLEAIDYEPYLIAKGKGWFDKALEEYGFKVEYMDPFQSAPPINESFATSRVDAVLTAEVPTIIGRAGGIDISIVWLSATLNSELVLPTDSKANSLIDLKGKTIAGLAGTSPHYGLVKNLKKIGLNKDDVKFVDMPPPEAKAAFESGVIDGWVIWPPFVEQEIVAGKGKVLQGFVSPVQVVLAMRGEFAKKNPEVAHAIVQTLEKGKKWIIQNSVDAQQFISKELRLPLKVVEIAWPKVVWEADINVSVIADIQGKADFLKELGFIRLQVNVEKDLIYQIPNAN